MFGTETENHNFQNCLLSSIISPEKKINYIFDCLFRAPTIVLIVVVNYPDF